jgi:hypothetical protein
MALTRNLRTLEERTYSCPPRQAVMAAYAQERGDWNTWEYRERYGANVRESSLCFYCGDWATFKDEREG